MKKTCGDTKALEDISLSLYQGELLCVAGPSGGGKSALVDIISGGTSKGRGRMYVGGRSAVLTSISQTQTAEVFCVRYRMSVISDISVEESLRLLRKQNCMSFPARQGIIRMRETLKILEIGCRLQAPVASLSLMERHTIEIRRILCTGMKALILDGIARDYVQKETEYMKRLTIRLKEKGISTLWIDTRPEIMLDVADRLAILREGWSTAVLYREEFDQQMIDRIIIGENREVGWEVVRSQAEPGGRGMLLSVREIRATKLRDVSFHVCPGEVVGFIHPNDTYYWEIVRPLSGELRVESGGMWLAGRQMELAGGRKNMVRYGLGYIKDYKKNLFLRLDVAENLAIAGLEHFASGVRVREKLERAVVCDHLTLLNIREEDLKRPIETLSHRYQLDVALYKWIITKVRLVVIDNLFSGTDILARSSVRESLKFVRGGGIGIVYCSPSKSELSSVCNRLYELAEGKISYKQHIQAAFPVSLYFFVS